LGRVKVTINKKGHIPQLGIGPIRRPILITKELCNSLIKLGYPVTIIQPSIDIKPNEKKDVVSITAKKNVLDLKIEQPKKEIEKESNTTIVTENIAEVKEKPAVTTIVEEEQLVAKEIIEEKEEITNTDEVEEILIDDLDLSAESFYTEKFLTSKVICKKILSNRQVQYEDGSSFVLLKKLVIDTNPEVEFIEE